MKNDIKIRSYQEEDALDLASIYYNAIHEVCTKDYNREQIEAWAPESAKEVSGWLKKWRKLPPLVATINNRPVGFAEFENNGHIDCFYCDPAFNSKGVGSMLLAKIEEIAAAKNINKIFAEVSITAKSFFEKKGFEAIKKQKVTIRGVELVNFKMEKLLNIP